METPNPPTSLIFYVDTLLRRREYCPRVKHDLLESQRTRLKEIDRFRTRPAIDDLHRTRCVHIADLCPVTDLQAGTERQRSDRMSRQQLCSVRNGNMDERLVRNVS
nr:hypothetical protein CFP56_10942 [Quercus suber]